MADGLEWWPRRVIAWPAQGGGALKIRFVLGFLIGVMLGASMALAFAPQPGVATRQQLWVKVKERASRNSDDR